MVGIGGGVPSETDDIRLGDIIVSKPGPDNGGVVQYDFGKTIRENRFIRTGSLNKPPTALLTALSTVQAKHKAAKYGYIEYLSTIPEPLQQEFSRPGTDKDRLFAANYDHVGNNPTCDHCDPEMVKKRAPRASPVPRVFYGTIASANQVMRLGAIRDKRAEECKALCFEMEAAGLMDDFPCVVIRGICDYADSHKNKQWQPYAAYTAATYAKELLSVIASEAVSKISPMQPPDVGTLTAIRSSSKLTSVPSPPKELSSEPENLSYNPASSSTDISANAFFVLNKFKSVALGRLVLDIRAPWEDYCPHTPMAGDDDIGTSPEPRLWNIMEKSKGTPMHAKLTSSFSSILSLEDPLTILGSASEKSYILSNSGHWFKNFCRTESIRRWIEDILKVGWDIYMVVGIHTLRKLPAGHSGPEDRVIQGKPSPDANEEIIIAVQYRKVVFRWFRKRDVDSAFLDIGENRWEPLLITKMSEVSGQNEDGDIIEADLQDDVRQEDLQAEGDVFDIAGQILIL